MENFDPIRNVENATLVCDQDGSWPSFHDASIYTVNIWHGDLRPEDNVWIGPQIEVTLGLMPMDEGASASILRIHFSDCDEIELQGFEYGGPMIYDLDFQFEERGYLTDGMTPLLPYIHVTFSFGPAIKPLLKFRCFAVKAIDRSVQGDPPYA